MEGELTARDSGSLKPNPDDCQSSFVIASLSSNSNRRRRNFSAFPSQCAQDQFGVKIVALFVCLPRNVSERLTDNGSELDRVRGIKSL